MTTSISRALVPAAVAVLLMPAIFAQTFMDESKLRRGDPGYERPKMESARVTLHPHGFHPKEVTFTAGLINLQVRNRSGLDDLPLVFERKSANRTPQDVIRNERTVKGRSRWEGDAELPAGEYVLRVDGRPEWTVDVHVLAEPALKR